MASYSVLLGSRDEQNPYTAELAAMAFALKCMPLGLRDRDITHYHYGKQPLGGTGRLAAAAAVGPTHDKADI